MNAGANVGTIDTPELQDDFRTRADNILDRLAFEKANRGGPIRWEEF